LKPLQVPVTCSVSHPFVNNRPSGH